MLLKTILALAVMINCCDHISAELSGKNDPEMVKASEHVSSIMADVWVQGADMMRVLWKDCSKKVYENDSSKLKKEFFTLMATCVKKKTLLALDRSLSSDIIPLGQGVQLVRYERINKEGKSLSSVTHPQEGNATQNKLIDEYVDKGDWRYLVLERMARVFNTHVLKIDLHHVEEKQEIAEFRHRRRHQMVQMMMFGIMSMGMILVPMGFQFLAVLGGKALLLAKLALILSSIQGLKKIATSPINYGLYHSYPTTSYDTTFEKRGYDRPPHPTILYTDVHDWSPPIEETKAEGDKVKYHYDGERKTWQPDRELKRPAFSVANGQNVYPVYGVPPSEASFNRYPQVYPSLAPADAGVDHAYGDAASPSEIHAEYTIDLPVNKVQLRSSGPFLSAAY